MEVISDRLNAENRRLSRLRAAVARFLGHGETAGGTGDASSTSDAGGVAALEDVRAAFDFASGARDAWGTQSPQRSPLHFVRSPADTGASAADLRRARIGAPWASRSASASG
jgi:hypothetical protein